MVVVWVTCWVEGENPGAPGRRESMISTQLTDTHSHLEIEGHLVKVRVPYIYI